jgi:tetratricopeptide (TPR) repeat protein/transcriptional regulator with XRE-family HTH domain
VAEPRVTFAGLLRQLRTDARMTQEELAEASGVSLRSLSDLERGRVGIPQRETVRLLADALRLSGPARSDFEEVARGRAATGGVAAATRTLPRDVASFTGRQRELRELMAAVAGAADAGGAGRPGGVVGIHAIGVMAGVGKTAFAVHAAHRLAERFPGGQIFLPLHGHTPGQQPVDPQDALASLLLAAGVPAAQVPPGLEARMALWRDRLARQQLLLILDDAVGSEQIQPLLPGAGGSLVLVTSRRHLSALEDAIAVSLDTLPPEEAAGLLVRLAGRTRLMPGDPGVREITRLCGYLPLAIGLMARQLRHHPAWSAAGRAAELAAAVDRLELIAAENVSVAAAFDLSYAALSPDLQRLFRRLGLHPGNELDGYAAAALDAVGLAAARRGLEGLYDQCLLTEPTQGRYRMHDLIREHAHALAGRLDTDHDRDGATTRLLDYYQHTIVLAAAALISRQTRPAAPGQASADDAVPAEVPALASSEQALAWARAERASLLACLDYAVGTGQTTRVVALTAALAGLLRRDGPWAEAATRHTAAIEAARYLGDRLGEANALNELGAIWLRMGDFPAAAQEIEQALGVYRELGDRLGQAGVLRQLGAVRHVMGDYLAADQALEQALGISSDLGDRFGQANALRALGELRWGMGDPAAPQALEQALVIFRDIGNQLGQANALRALGFVRRITGDYQAAAQLLEEALSILTEMGDVQGQANVLNYLGHVRRATGDYPAAAQVLERALGIYRDLGERLGQANVLAELGAARRATGDYQAAAQVLERALGTYRDLGNRLGQANALTELGSLRRATGDYPAAVQAQEQALAICRDIGNRIAQANALTELGAARRLAGDYPAAAQAQEQALAICRDLGYRDGEAAALNETGTLYRVSGDPAQAEGYHQQALDLARAITTPRREADALAGLGRCALAGGHLAQAQALLRQALEISQRIGAAVAPDLLAELDALTGPPPVP